MPSNPSSPRLRQLRQSATPTWLLTGEVAVSISATAASPGRRTLVVRTTAEFRRALLEARPRLVVVASSSVDAESAELALLERRRRPGMRLVHLSPASDVQGRIDALRRGYDDALSEDLAAMEIAARLVRLEASAGRPVEPAILAVADGFVLDPRAHALRGPEGDVHLRPKEYALLLLLASNPGQAFRRDELLRRVWGPDTASTSRTVDVHVRWLRCKIEALPEQPVHLLTVRGVGYRLEPFAVPHPQPTR